MTASVTAPACTACGGTRKSGRRRFDSICPHGHHCQNAECNQLEWGGEWVELSCEACAPERCAYCGERRGAVETSWGLFCERCAVEEGGEPTTERPERDTSTGEPRGDAVSGRSALPRSRRVVGDRLS